jgi:cholesterol transport system auxiliary component
MDIQRQEKGGAVTSRRFEAVIPNVQAKAAPVAQAIGTASNDVAGQVASWIAG